MAHGGGPDLFEWAPDAYVVTDPAGSIVMANRAAREVFAGGDPAEPAGQLEGTALTHLVAEDDRRRIRDALAGLATGERQAERVVAMLRADGSTFEGAVTVRMVGMADAGSEGDGALALWLVRDVTDRFA